MISMSTTQVDAHQINTKHCNNLPSRTRGSRETSGVRHDSRVATQPQGSGQAADTTCACVDLMQQGGCSHQILDP